MFDAPSGAIVWTFYDSLAFDGSNRFGDAVALSSSTAFVADPGRDSVYAYDLDAGFLKWTTISPYILDVPVSGLAGLGQALALSYEGLIVAGSRYHSRIVAYLLDVQSGKPRRQYRASRGVPAVSISVWNARVLMGFADVSSPGIALLFRKGRRQPIRLRTPHSERESDAGRAVALVDTLAVVGTPGDNEAVVFAPTR